MVEHKALQDTGLQRSSWSNLGRAFRRSEHTDPSERSRPPAMVKQIARDVVALVIAWPIVTFMYLSFDKITAPRER